MKTKRNTELFTYVHFMRQKQYDIETQIKEFISEELKYNNKSNVAFIESDIIDWFYSDDIGNEVAKEDSLIVGGLKDNTYRVRFSRTIISDYQGDEFFIRDWYTQNDYFLESNVCEHNNTITNECSDCNEQELIDGHHQRVLRESLREIYNICCDSLDDIVSHHCEGYKDFIYEVEENVKQEIYNRLNYEYTCTKKETK